MSLVYEKKYYIAARIIYLESTQKPSKMGRGPLKNPLMTYCLFRILSYRPAHPGFCASSRPREPCGYGGSLHCCRSGYHRWAIFPVTSFMSPRRSLCQQYFMSSPQDSPTSSSLPVSLPPDHHLTAGIPAKVRDCLFSHEYKLVTIASQHCIPDIALWKTCTLYTYSTLNQGYTLPSLVYPVPCPPVPGDAPSLLPIILYLRV